MVYALVPFAVASAILAAQFGFVTHDGFGVMMPNMGGYFIQIGK